MQVASIHNRRGFVRYYSCRSAEKSSATRRTGARYIRCVALGVSVPFIRERLKTGALSRGIAWSDVWTALHSRAEGERRLGLISFSVQVQRTRGVALLVATRCLEAVTKVMRAFFPQADSPLQQTLDEPRGSSERSCHVFWSRASESAPLR